MSDNSQYMVECENLIKIYKSKDMEVVALRGLDFRVRKGEVLAVIGKSGSGKSTLLNMLGGLDIPTTGRISISGRDLSRFSRRELMRYKLETVGFVWQNNARNVIPYLTALENVEFPMIIAGKHRKRERAVELLEAVGLGHRMESRLSQFSGGELQRVGIAIALANSPELLLADEPTGAVDTKTTDQILDVFHQVNRLFGVTVIIVTHDKEVARKVDRVVSISDGRTSSEFLRKVSFIGEPAYTEAAAGSMEAEDAYVELAVVDSNRCVQLPAAFLSALGMGSQNMVSINLVGHDIVISSPNDFLQTRNKTPGVSL